MNVPAFGTCYFIIVVIFLEKKTIISVSETFSFFSQDNICTMNIVWNTRLAVTIELQKHTFFSFIDHQSRNNKKKKEEKKSRRHEHYRHFQIESQCENETNCNCCIFCVQIFETDDWTLLMKLYITIIYLFVKNKLTLIAIWNCGGRKCLNLHCVQLFEWFFF